MLTFSPAQGKSIPTAKRLKYQNMNSLPPLPDSSTRGDAPFSSQAPALVFEGSALLQKPVPVRKLVAVCADAISVPFLATAHETSEALGWGARLAC